MQEKGDFDVELGHPYMIWEGHWGRVLGVF